LSTFGVAGLAKWQRRWSVKAAHTVIALDANGDRFLQALKDPELQKIAWESHGFRSGIQGVQNISPVAGISTSVIESSPRPSADVMERIIAALGPASAAHPTPTGTPAN